MEEKEKKEFTIDEIKEYLKKNESCNITINLRGDEQKNE